MAVQALLQKEGERKRRAMRRRRMVLQLDEVDEMTSRAAPRAFSLIRRKWKKAVRCTAEDVAVIETLLCPLR